MLNILKSIKDDFINLKLSNKILIFVFSLIFSFFNIFGSVYKDGYLRLRSFNLQYTIIIFFILLIISYIIFSALSVFLLKVNLRSNNQIITNENINKSVLNINSNIKYFLFSFLVIFIFWFLVLLAYYPGIFAYDSTVQIYQMKYGFSVHHPLLHSLLLCGFYLFGVDILGDANLGIFFFTLLQMLFLDFCLSYMNLFLYKINIKKSIRLFLIIFESIMPIYSVLSVSITKDIQFTSFMVLLSTCILENIYLKEEAKKISHRLLFVFSVIGFVLFRSQSIYILIVFIIINLIFLRKNNFIKNITKYIFIALIISIGINACLKKATNAIPVKFTEYFNLPIQGMARVFNTKESKLDLETIEEYYTLSRNPKLYTPFLADTAKYVINLDFDLFKKLYFKTLKKFPWTHFEAYVVNNLGYVYINDISEAQIYGKPSQKDFRSDKGYFTTDQQKGTYVTADSKLKPLEYGYEYLFTKNNYRNIPIFHFLFQLALYFYLFFFSFMICIMKNNKKLLPIYILVLLYIGTMLLGPCVLVRYAFPYIAITIPLFFITLTNNNEQG